MIENHYLSCCKSLDECYCGKQETLEEAAEKWVFETNSQKWSNNNDTAGDNFGSFIAGAKWKQFKKEIIMSYEQAQIEALRKELQKYKEICEQFQRKYDEVKALNLDAIDPIFLKPIEK